MNALSLQPGTSRKSAYNLRNPVAEGEERHTLVVLVDNEAGVLARVIGLFSGRGYNIESLTVAEVDHLGHRSRITILEELIDHIRSHDDVWFATHEEIARHCLDGGQGAAG